jgi:DNA-binding LacI/PurR family transcriptional regulator
MAVTIRDVAREAGVSTATVSKVINKVPSISEATVSKVNHIMRELNYHPNLRAQNFARKSTRSIVFITNLERNTAFINPHMFEIMSGLQNVLNNKNYTLSILSVNLQEELEVIDRIIAQNSADGLVIHASVITKEMSVKILKAGFPHIIIGCPNFESQLCWIDNNNYLSGEIAANHLLEQGYRRIAYVGGEEKDMISTHRLQGAITAITDKKLKLEEEFIKRGESTKQDGYRMAQELCALKQLPDAIICANNYIALGVIKCVTEKGLRIPGDMGVISFDDYPFSRITDPMMTVVNIDVYDVGVQAGKLILSKIKKPNLQVQSFTTLPSLIVRESTKLERV